MLNTQSVFKILLLGLTFLTICRPQFCVAFPSVLTSIISVQQNDRMGGHVGDHINCAALGATSFLSWAQMLGGQRFWNCVCAGAGNVACVYNFNQDSLLQPVNNICHGYRFACARYVFGRNVNNLWILVTAYPSDNCQPGLQEAENFQVFTELEPTQLVQGMKPQTPGQKKKGQEL